MIVILQRIWRLSTTGAVPKRSLTVAVVVGTTLNLINQGDVLFSGVAPNWSKIVLTFIVPYCVSTYGAVSALWSRSDP